MKIQEILEAKSMKRDDDFDDVEEPVADADTDKIPNILMQLRKAIDVDGNYPITFRDNSKKKLSMDQISDFVKKYMKAKPAEKEMMQSRGANSLEDFMAVLSEPEKPEFQHKIKGDRYMSHFSGDLD